MKTFDLGFGCLGNGITVWDRKQYTGSDYKTVAHIAAYGGVKLYDQRIKTSPEDLRRIIDMARRQQLAERDDWPKGKSAEWMYQK